MQIQFDPRRGSVRRGFTLIEILVVISIVALLAGLALPLYQNSMTNVRRVKGLSNLKQTGAAIMAYAGEHEATLPGPCGLGLMPRYKKTDKTSLAWYLATYLGLPDPDNCPNYVVATPLLSPGMVAWKATTANADNGIPHYIQSDVLRGNTPKGGTGTIRPFGSDDDNPPIKLSRMGDFTNVTTGAPISTSQAWLLSDVDQQTTDTQARTSGWFSQLPLKPVYGTKRLRVYADGHAEAANLTE